MSDFTFLTKEQYFGKDRLDIIEKSGTKAAITDFSILLGGLYIGGDDSLEGRAGYYWTKSTYGKEKVRLTDSNGRYGLPTCSLPYGWCSPSFTVLINR